MTSIWREWLFSLVIALICVGLWFVDISKIPRPAGGLHCRGLIIAVDNSQVRVNLIVKTENQFLTVRLLNGPHKGHVMSITNMLTGKMELDEFYETGKVILVEYDIVDGKPRHGMARGYYRLQFQLILICLFGLAAVDYCRYDRCESHAVFCIHRHGVMETLLPIVAEKLSAGVNRPGNCCPAHRSHHVLGLEA